jgi:hypothetical protein
MRAQQQGMAVAGALARILVFFLVHGLVGAMDKAFAIVTPVEFGNADTAAHRNCRTAEIDEVLIQHHLDFFSAGNAAVAIAFGQENGEFIAADARHAVIFANLQLQQLANGAEYPVAGQMALDIIDGFEIIKVNQGENAAITVATGGGQGAVKLPVKATPVHQTGYFIGERQGFQKRNAPALFGEALFRRCRNCECALQQAALI